MNIFRVALIKGHLRIIPVHNHSSGNLRPSNEDKNLTDGLIQVGCTIDFTVDDHLVISIKDYYSFADST